MAIADAGEGGKWEDVRISLGAVAPTPIRVKEAEGLLKGEKPAVESIEKAARLAKEAARPIFDVRASAEYRREMACALVKRALKSGHLDPIQEAFVHYGAVQCGFCTPGMILSARALLDENRNPSEDEIRRAIAGNLCRCTGYIKIVQAIKACADKLRS